VTRGSIVSDFFIQKGNEKLPIAKDDLLLVSRKNIAIGAVTRVSARSGLSQGNVDARAGSFSTCTDRYL